MPISRTIKRVKIGEKKVVLVLDDESKIEIHPNVYTEYNFFKGKTLTKKQIDEIKSRNEIKKYISYATNLASARSYTKHKIKEKLLKKGANDEQIEQVIDVLIKYQLLDEVSFVKEFLEYADYKHYGYNRVKDELFKKGVSSYYVDKIKYDENRDLKLAKELIKPYEKKFAKYNYAMMKKHIYDALIRQGYSYNVASLALENVSSINEKKEKELLKIEYQKAKRKYLDKFGEKTTKEKITQYLLQKGFAYKDILSLKEE